MTGEKPKSKVLLVVDHPLVREHLTALLGGESDLEVGAEPAGSGTTAETLAGRMPDLVVVDFSSNGSRGIDLLKELKEIRPKLPVLVLSMYDDVRRAERALRAGATGYITQEGAAANILPAVRAVLADGVYLSTRMEARMQQQRQGQGANEIGSPLEVLTEREWEMFQRIGRGMETRQIAGELRLGVRTVESYRRRIQEKLGLADGRELQRQAAHWTEKITATERSQP